ncbi:hypothetical protein D0869_00986 [Hortaea werneckii]|uniref:Sec20 C-terminal domain-containing protein n=1 Tax=Hortaea werneckii TaxID=91943 RepID=A0A3M6YNJ5_HORWE|nr:hypothetical protein KC324_g13331 [Hortaea werneckii]KAI7565192.1 hypothetical protein KC316_g12567 [Hortaea werneckii]KAI7673626.1 hypothetical protein KC318_g2118 [Hortaea werneckii]RMX89273.1 hypothetical protein D0869_00986 [Hortaea werneckii]RMY00013.1 hypothetical protein D0868_09236 [Hortaea werneckii]
MSASTLQLAHQLTALTDALKTTNALITRLARLSFQPGSEPLDTENSVRVELAQDIHDSLKQLEEDLELLQQEVDDDGHSATASKARRETTDRERERGRITANVTRLGEDLRHARSSFRQAQLSAKRASEDARRKERELLFQSLQSAPSAAEDTVDSVPDGSGSKNDLFAGRRLQQTKPTQHLSPTDLESQASSDITAALRRTHNLLSTELSRSRFAQETFNTSTLALQELGEHYTNLDTILTNSRNLLGTLLRSQKSDTWYLETAFYILLSTLAWLIFRRVLFGPFIKLPLFVWNCLWFVLKWLVLKPLWWLLILTGIVTTEPIPVSATRTGSRKATPSTTRAPLIVKPSAQGGPWKMPSEQERQVPNGGMGIPVGAGGGGAKVGPDGVVLEGKSSEEIAQMHRQSEAEAVVGGKEPQRRGDGTILQERGDIPKNPKKKTFDAGADRGGEESKPRAKRDEL